MADIILLDNNNSISLDDLLAVNTAPISGIQPSEPDKEVEFILRPSAETGVNAFSAVTFRDQDGVTTGQLKSDHAGTPSNISLHSESRPLYLNAVNDNVVIQGLAWPNADGDVGQALITDGAGNLSWGASAAGNTENYTIASSIGMVLATGNRYLVIGSISINLPSYVGMTPGEAVTISKQADATPIITTQAGENMNSDRGVANELVYDSTDEIVFAYDGTMWQLQYTGVDIPVDLPTELTDMEDVSITTPVEGQVLRHNGTEWVNAQIEYDDIAGTPDVSNAKYITPTNGQILDVNRSYFINGDIAVTLPDYVPLSPGDNIRITKAASLQPTVNATAGQDIESDIGIDTAMLYDVSDEVVFIYNGVRWQVQYSGTSSSNVIVPPVDMLPGQTIASVTKDPDLSISVKAIAEFQTRRRNGDCKIFRSGNVTSVARTAPGIYQVIIENKTVGGMNIGTESTAIVDLNFLTAEDDSSGWEVAGITKKAGNGMSYVTFKIVHILADGSRVVEEPVNNGYKNKILVRII